MSDFCEDVWPRCLYWRAAKTGMVEMLTADGNDSTLHRRPDRRMFCCFNGLVTL